MKHTSKALSLLLAAAMTAGLSVPAMAAETTGKEDGIVVLYTNDVHCTSDNGTSYAAIAGYKAEMEAAYGTDNVTLVDNGDAIQGGTIGALSKGSWIVDIMNEVGYDLAIPGNHEFDFGTDTLFDIAKNQAEYTYLSCNFLNDKGDAVFRPYIIVTYGDVDVAYVGISTPETLTKSAPAYFQNDKGEYIYGFCQGNEGKDLYNKVQETVDAARKEGADYVVAMAHLGEDGQSSPWMSTEVIANTTGIDVMLDGHSHTVEPSKLVKNADGKDVLLSQTGTKAASVGKLVIDADGKMSTELVDLTKVDTTSEAYTKANKFITSIQDQYTAETEKVIGTTEVDLTINDPTTGERAVRSAETNLGDLCADAYRIMLGADIGWVNGGGVRDNIAAGDITYGEVIAVHPFGNMACLVEVTGQQILDALELGSMHAGSAENGGFLQVSGLKYTINTAIPTSVVLDDAGNFVSVSGARRVSDVQVLNSETNTYAPIDAKATYTLASHNYMLKDGGDGYAMFGADNIKILKDEVMVDNEVLINYIKDELGGKVGEAYANPTGDGRITIVNEPVSGNWYDEAVAYVTDAGYMQGTGTGFDPTGTVTRGTVYQTLYNMSGKPAVAEKATFTDVEGKWYADAAAWAEDTGLSNGNGAGLFEGDRAMTRAELATALARYAELNKITVEKGTGMEAAPDYAQIADWALDGMSFCYYGKVMTGDNTGALRPNATAQRAELAKMLMAFDGLKTPAGETETPAA